MKRKLRLQIDPTVETAALARFLSTCREDARDSWETLMSSAELIFAGIVEEQRELKAMFEAIEDAEGVSITSEVVEINEDVDEVFEDCELESFTAEFDLPTVMSDPDDGLRILRALNAVAEFASGRDSHVFEVRISNQSSDTDGMTELLEEYASAYGLSLDPDDEPDVDLGDDGEEGEEEEEEDEWAGVRAGQRSVPPTPPGPGKGRVTGRYAKGSGSFGGLNEETTTRVGGPVGIAFEHTEQYFIHHFKLKWPVSASDLQTAYRRVATTAHPDLHPDDPNALQRFKDLMEGHNKLKKRLA